MSKNLIKMSSSVFNNLLWSASRYCIGRHSYVSSYAQDFWGAIRENHKMLKEERLEAFARDIRANISSAVGLYSNVHVENAYNDRIECDAYSLLAQYKHSHPEVDESSTMYYVDCIAGTVDVSEWELKEGVHSYTEFHVENETDLLQWAMLANCIDRQYEIVMKTEAAGTNMCVENPATGDFAIVSCWSMIVNEEYIAEVRAVGTSWLKNRRYENL